MNFENILAAWYKKNKRDLPWRKTKEPYPVWISEIILQQTRIDQGTAYYHRFLERFPGIRELADADEEAVLKLWQGLGYYSRARNLHAASKEIMTRHDGIFPSGYEDIRKLKGVGDYTAAAIASISFGLPYPVIDGNVLRFFSRYFGISDPVDTQKGKAAVLKKAQEFINKDDPGDFNQAVMELGALQCRPGIPDCTVCPFNKDCFAFSHNSIADFPVKSKTQAQRTRYFHYLVITTKSKKDTSIFLKKRTGNDIWKNLFDFPLIETTKAVNLKKLVLSAEWKEITGPSYKVISESKVHRHILSHQVILAKFYILEVPAGTKFPYYKVSLKEPDKYPVPRLIEIFLKSNSL
ncbi:MAG: A/G-specific adenine glycosylase [Bacteroidetes bacterium]|nr:A/G-specific adenine glycosylase [Bacteroidota bacterium]